MPGIWREYRTLRTREGEKGAAGGRADGRTDGRGGGIRRSQRKWSKVGRLFRLSPIREEEEARVKTESGASSCVRHARPSPGEKGKGGGGKAD